MKNVNLLSVFALAILLYACGGSTETTQTTEITETKDTVASLADGSYEVVKEESQVNWKGKKVTGEHFGTIAIEKGSVSVAGGKLTGAEVTIDMNTLAVTDIPADDESNGKLKGHLMSPDFFDVAKAPKAMLKVTEVTGDANPYTVKGMLTIKGIEKEISFPLTVETVANNVLSAKGTMMVDRTLYDIKFNSGKFFKGLGDKLIDDMFEVSFDIKAKM